MRCCKSSDLRGVQQPMVGRKGRMMGNGWKCLLSDVFEFCPTVVGARLTKSAEVCLTAWKQPCRGTVCRHCRESTKYRGENVHRIELRMQCLWCQHGETHGQFGSGRKKNEKYEPVRGVKPLTGPTIKDICTDRIHRNVEYRVARQAIRGRTAIRLIWCWKAKLEPTESTKKAARGTALVG